jgi:hypothetical protein
MRVSIQSLAMLVIASVVLTTGCASITRGTTEAYAVQTTPPGAEVNSSSGWRCLTPCSVKVKRRSDFVLTITKPGYETVTATVTSSVDGAGAAGMAGNVLLGGIIGAGVDAGTGAMHSHKPNPLVVEMVPLGQTGTAGNADSQQPGADIGQTYVDATNFVDDSIKLRAVTAAGREECQYITSVSKGAGGNDDPSANLERAMQNAFADAASKGADSYFIVDTRTTLKGSSVVLEALRCE